MKSTIQELLGSKRFFVTALAVLVCGIGLALGYITPEQATGDVEKLMALLSTLYGLENAVAAIPAKPAASDAVKP